MTKHHWLAASALLLICGWITHATTAMLSDNISDDQAASFSELLSPIEPAEQNSYFFDIDKQLSLINKPISLQDLKRDITKTITHKISKGESLDLIFNKLKLDDTLPYKISKNELGKKLVSLSIGKELAFLVDNKNNLKQISYPLNSLQELVIDINAQDIEGTRIADLPYKKKQNIVSGEIVTSLYEAAQEAGLSNNLIMEVVRIFGWDIDFILETHKGDTFHVIYNDYMLDGEKLSDGDIIAAEFTNQGHTYRAVRYEDAEGNANYYTPDGESVIGAFLRSPVEFSRISSGFSKRRYHPVLKKWRAHKGVDYAASRGTPIRATASGTIFHVGRKGGYGKTVIVRHPGQVKTLYAHLNGYKKGLRSGNRVTQGQIIGYVGSTGLATGPHLHYEYQVGGKHKNPLNQKSTKTSSIKKSQLAAFQSRTQHVLARLDSVSNSYLAKAKNADSKKLL